MQVLLVISLRNILLPCLCQSPANSLKVGRLSNAVAATMFGFVDLERRTSQAFVICPTFIDTTRTSSSFSFRPFATYTYTNPNRSMPRFPDTFEQHAMMGSTQTDIKSPQEHQTEQPDRIRVKNRRKRYLDLHPEYFREPYLELAGRRCLGSSYPILPHSFNFVS